MAGKANKIRQIVRLKQIVKRWQRVASSSHSDEVERDHGAPQDVPQGYLAVYVGDVMQRFIIPTEYLNLPVFKSLLEKAEEEFGFNHGGALKLPLDPHIFEHLTRMLARNESNARNLTLDQLLTNFHVFEPDCGSRTKFSGSPSLNQLGLRA